MIPDIVVAVREKTDVAAARRAALELGNIEPGGSDAGKQSDLAIVVTEAASNLIKHGGGGEIIMRKIEDGVELLAIDRGPGIPDIERSFEDGYSTAGSPGTGLGAIRRVSSFCDIYTAPEKGVVLLARVGGSHHATSSHSSVPQNMQVGAVCVAYPGETISGDGWAFREDRRCYRLVVADGLGHGPHAAEASDAALRAVMGGVGLSPREAVEDAHIRIRPTRGAALSLLDANLDAGTVSYAGVGNVSGAIIPTPETRRQMVNVNGTLGHELRKAQQYSYPLPDESLVVLHSDGLSTHWSLDKYPGLFYRHPGVIAGVLFRDFRRLRDDATVIVIRSGRNGI